MINNLALICYHTCPLNPPGEGKSGAMNLYVSEIASSLSKMGIHIDIFTRAHPGHDHIEHLNKAVRIIHLDDESVETDPNDLINNAPIFKNKLRHFIEFNGTPYQIFHSHYWLSAFITEQLSVELNVPHVTTFHTLAKLKMQSGLGTQESQTRISTEQQIIQDTTKIIAFSRNEKDAIVNLYGGNPEKIATLPCGVDLSLFKPNDIGLARRKLGLENNNVLLSVGRLESLKGIDLLLRASAYINSPKPLKVLIAGGDSETSYRNQYLASLVEKLNLNEIVDFIGQVDHQDLPQYYNAADVCVVPSLYESFGLVALESMACGTPVIASRVGGLPTIIKHGSTGYLKSWRCPETFAASIEMIVKNPNLQQTMGLKARSRAETMSWYHLANNMVSIYDSMAHNKHYARI